MSVCEYSNCKTRPSFNLTGQTKGRFCAKHRLPEMVDVQHKTCESEGCRKRPNYNLAGETKGRFCVEHKEEKMVNVKSKTCESEGCRKLPSYNLAGETNGRFCVEHKEENMVNVSRPHSSCIEEGCTSKPSHGWLKKRAVYCQRHSKKGMLELSLTLKCHQCGAAPFSMVDERYYCMSHYPDQKAVSQFKRQCQICDLADSQYICKQCEGQRHKKEWNVVCLLKKQINLRPVLDSNLPVKQCSNRRPDVYYQCLTHCVIVEIDEDQHRRYNPECECSRISEIVSSLGGYPLTIVRYNPDRVINRERVVNIDKNRRFDLLVETVKHELNNPPDRFQVKLIQLYYDDNYEIYQEYKEEDITSTVAV